MKKLLIFIAFCLLSELAGAQILKPVKWSYAAKRINSKEAVVLIKATIENGWHIYSQNIAANGPTRTVFSFNPSKDFTLVGKTLEPKAVTHFDKMFDMNIGYFEKEVVFQQKINIKSKGKITIKGKLEYGTCDDHQCLPPEEIVFNVSV
ncbi:protein-disulfide reductase DsbD N-terminal domain-containing protein [Pedobacter metabolipauper]|uniref:Disulfide bond corrector protein DsbC n=1 Tax=Pedobacter metabolipauper TaxID=425513 RepID=A0A4R6T0D6_9SPHI|nr:protein-disulfide reductase DsbD N-terminal domain-containing protein [Pedobacter metabolipauper]TDQ11837.1 disulfide bond corrector protein DsbC [Pedobacter metabolipauper]